MAEFAIVMPVFNKEPFLEEAIESVIKQTINFKNNIELIIVNDGSTDKSNEICEYYKCLYPENIKYVEIKNSGPAIARNFGCECVSSDTKFIGFLDADDKYQENVLEKVKSFFENYTADVAVIPLVFYDSKGTTKSHPLNYRFNDGDRMIDIIREYDAIHFYAGGLFIRKSLFDNRQFYFDESFTYWEDAFSINKYLLMNKLYGVVTDTTYYYRKEINGDSIVDNIWGSKQRFLHLVRTGYLGLIKESFKIYDELLPYIQYLITYHIKLYLYKRGSNAFMELLTESEKREFVSSIINILRYINDEIILEQNMKHYYKEFLISLKKNGWPTKLYRIPLDKPEGNIIIKKKKFLGYGVKIIGYYDSVSCDLPQKSYISIKSGKKIFNCPKKEINKEISIWGMVVRNYKYAGFEIVLPLSRLNLEFYLNNNGNTYKLNSINYYERFMRKFRINTKKKFVGNKEFSLETGPKKDSISL